MFYLVVIQKMVDGTTAQAVWSKETLDAAESAFHLELSQRGDERVFTSCVILNEACVPVKSAEFWVRPTVQAQE